MHITSRGLRFVDVGIIYHILGKVVLQISFTHYRNILAHNTALFTRGNSGLPRLNSSRKSSDIPFPTQSPIWVNPMGPITLSFGKKCYNVTTCKLAAQNVFSFLPHRLRSLHQGYFHDLIDQQSTLSADRYSCQRNSFSAECTCRLHAVVSMTLCAVWRKQTSARSSRPIKIGQHPHDNWIT